MGAEEKDVTEVPSLAEEEEAEDEEKGVGAAVFRERQVRFT